MAPSQSIRKRLPPKQLAAIVAMPNPPAPKAEFPDIGFIGGKPAGNDSNAPGGKPAGNGSNAALLVIEAFAGSYTVGRYFAANKAQQADGFYLAAYAAIELEAQFHAKAAAARDLGLSPSTYLNINGSVSDFQVHSQLLHFVNSKLQDPTQPIDGVVVFGGPPCTAYTKASRLQAKEKLDLLEHDYQAALLEHARQDRLLLALGGQATKGAKAAATRVRNKAAAKAEGIKEAIEAAAKEAAGKAHFVLQSDSLVKSFLSLFKTIEVECREWGVPCWLLMENPYSIPERALWNRPFMQEHLTRLPNWPAAQELPFRRTRQGWLTPVCQNWCTYGPNYPKKDTIIFTNLPKDALPDRFCRHHCQRPEGRRHTAVISEKKGAHERAMWPVEFVGAALQACVAAAPGAVAQAEQVIEGGDELSSESGDEPSSEGEDELSSEDADEPGAVAKAVSGAAGPAA